MPPEESQSPGSLLADDMYPADPPASDPPAAETPPADPPAGDPPVEDPPLAADDSGDPPGDPPGDDSNDIEVSSVEQLAEHFEFDPEWMQNLTIKQTVNGKEIDVSLGDALTTHRQVKSGESMLSEAKAKRKVIQAEANANRDQYSEAITSLGAVMQEFQKEMDADTKSIDWAALRRDDPAEYSARKDDVRDRQARFDKIKSDAVATAQGAIQQNDATQKQARLDRLPEEHKVFLERIPEWKDNDKASKEREKLVKYLSDDGYTEKDIQVASFNGKLLSMAVKSMRYDESKEKSQAAKKRVVKVPKVLKPGVQKPAPKSNGKDDDASVLFYGS
jgi:hypothetical protein